MVGPDAGPARSWFRVGFEVHKSSGKPLLHLQLRWDSRVLRHNLMADKFQALKNRNLSRAED